MKYGRRVGLTPGCLVERLKTSLNRARIHIPFAAVICLDKMRGPIEGRFKGISDYPKPVHFVHLQMQFPHDNIVRGDQTQNFHIYSRTLTHPSPLQGKKEKGDLDHAPRNILFSSLVYRFGSLCRSSIISRIRFISLPIIVGEILCGMSVDESGLM